MLLHIPATQPPRPLVRAFHATRVAHGALVQVYELLLPDSRRPLPARAPRAAASDPAPRRAAGR